MIKLDWQQLLVAEVQQRLINNQDQLSDEYSNVLITATAGVHLGIFVEPFLSLILDLVKTMESRYYINDISVHKDVKQGDVVLLKKSSGPVVGICTVGRVQHYRLTPVALNDIRKAHGKALCAEDQAFWRARADKRYVTLMQLWTVLRLSPVPCRKKDRRGWVVLRNRQETP